MKEDALADIQIRMAAPADVPSIAAVLRESFAEYKASYTDEAFAATAAASEQIQSRMNEGPVWVAAREAAIIGTVSVVPHSGALYIRGMAVLPSARGLRIGEALLKQVESFASAHGCERLLLSTAPFLARAIRLYERMGFKRSDEGPHDLCGTPLFTMEKEI
jgi:ribosomal protein S18 acetylase RimI-like enzyme